MVSEIKHSLINLVMEMILHNQPGEPTNDNIPVHQCMQPGHGEPPYEHIHEHDAQQTEST